MFKDSIFTICERLKSDTYSIKLDVSQNKSKMWKTIQNAKPQPNENV